jgi:hypothetical protein
MVKVFPPEACFALEVTTGPPGLWRAGQTRSLPEHDPEV